MYRDYDDIKPYEAVLNITYAGMNGDLPDPIPFGASDREIKRWATEAIESGSIPGIRRRKRVSLRGFVVDRFHAGRGASVNRVFVRPATPFG